MRIISAMSYRSYSLAFLLLFISSTGLAAEKSISITIKPSAGLAGIVSFNIHPDKSVTLLVYESAVKISEQPVAVDNKTVLQIIQSSEQVFNEYSRLDDYSRLPEYKQASAVAITQTRVTRSISTRRYSENMIALIRLITGFVAAEYRPQLEKI